jgi:hypothetical protein
MAKRAGARALADAGALKVVYQGTVLCAQKESTAITSESMINLAKGLVESLVYILDPARKRDVMEVLKKNLRLSKEEDLESSYRVTRLQMPNLDIVPNLEAWKTYRRIMARVNPKVQEADLEQIITASAAKNLEESGFLPEMRKKLPR